MVRIVSTSGLAASIRDYLDPEVDGVVYSSPEQEEPTMYRGRRVIRKAGPIPFSHQGTLLDIGRELEVGILE